jgi:hypothetical protein
MEIFQCRDIIIYPHIKFWWYRTFNFSPHFYAVFWQPFWKWQTSWKCWKRRIAPLMVTYHYVKIYVSMNLSTADLRNYRTEFHETWWSYRYIFLVDPKVFRFVVKGVKAIFSHIKFWWYRTMLNFYPPFLCRVLADILKILKTQNCSSNGDLSLCQNLCLYHYPCYSPFFPCTMNLSTADLRNYRTEFHETWWSYRYMFLVDPEVFRFVVRET